MRTKQLNGWLAAAVFGHLLITVAHGTAHSRGQVAITPAQSWFVYLVILIGPIAGLLLSYFSRRAGGLLIALTMAGSLVFGLVNHFIIISPDHVSQVAAEWRPLFAATAYLLIAAEALGTLTGLRHALGPREVLS